MATRPADVPGKLEAQIVWTRPNGGTDIIVADVNPSTQVDVLNDVVSAPIEDGSVISDHMISKPLNMTLDIAQTQTPVPRSSFDKTVGKETVELNIRPSQFEPGGLLAVTLAAGAAIAAIGSALGFGSDTKPTQVWTPNDATDRIEEFNDLLNQISESKSLVTVQVNGRRYPNMGITRIGYTRQAPEELGRFSVDLVQVTTVESSAAAAFGLSLPDPADLALAAAAAAGLLQSKTLEDTEQEIKSVLASGLDLF